MHTVNIAIWLMTGFAGRYDVFVCRTSGRREARCAYAPRSREADARGYHNAVASVVAVVAMPVLAPVRVAVRVAVWAAVWAVVGLTVVAAPSVTTGGVRAVTNAG